MKGITKLILLSLGGVFTVSLTLAQVTPPSLGLLFSQTNYGGTARIQGIGEAGTALGGDLSSITSNPAGLGFYNRSEVSITPIVGIHSTNSTFLDNDTKASKTSFGIGNIGIALSSRRPDNIPGSWKGGTFGFSYNRLNDFNNEVVYRGSNIENDYLDFLLDFGNTRNAQIGDYYLIDLPYEAYLINDYSINSAGDTTYGVWDTFVEYASTDTPVQQEEVIMTSGSLGRWGISYGGNFSDRFYFGFGLGIMSLRYKNEKTYSEVRYPGSLLNYYTLEEWQSIKGTGVNGTVGITVRAIKTLTIGISYTTPTAYTLTDEFETSVQSIWNESAFNYYGDDIYFTGNQLAEEKANDWTYTLKTPMRLNAGLAFFFNKNGFISADIEWVDYSKINFRFDQGDLNNDNQAIREMYKSVINYRIGGEYRKEAFRFRAGYNYLNDPFKDSGDVNRSKSTYSAGVGFRKAKFFFDLSILYNTYKGTRSPYIIYEDQGIGATPTADIKYNSTYLVLTGGFLF